jgi:acylphosphatase
MSASEEDFRPDKRVRVVIEGWVQGVGFRAECRHEAQRLGLAGWVRNRGDGSVEALFSGPAPAVDEMLRWCEHGPANAEVSGVEVTEAPEEAPGRSFNIRY